MFEQLKVGDAVTRYLGDVLPMELTVTALTDDVITCGPWTFDRHTGDEIDEDLGWGRGHTGSYLRETPPDTAADAHSVFILIKPDAVHRRLTGRVLAIFEDRGFRVIACSVIRLTTADVKVLYGKFENEPFYSRIKRFMILGTCLAAVLYHEHGEAVPLARALLGTTTMPPNLPGTIRGMWAEGGERNICHVSESAIHSYAEAKALLGIDTTSAKLATWFRTGRRLPADLTLDGQLQSD